MKARKYARIRYPWRASLETGTPTTISFYSRMIDEALRYGMPARRFGPAGARLARGGLPRWVVRAASTLAPRRPDPRIDELLERVRLSWDTVRARIPSIAENPGPLHAVGLQRSSSFTVFVLDERGVPLLVGKLARGEGSANAAEEIALRRAEPAQVAPLHVGRLGEVSVQQAIPGAPLTLQPLAQEAAAGLQWAKAQLEVGEAIVRLCGATAASEGPTDLDRWMGAAITSGGLSRRAHAAASAAAGDLRSLERSVLQHGDTSPQNCLFEGDRLTGLVDWERSTQRGVPGFDLLNFAVAYLEHSLGLRRWSEAISLTAFRTGWDASGFMAGARAGARAAAAAADIPDRFHDSIEVAFFARRLGRRLADPKPYATGPRTAAAMLEHVCAH